MGRKFSYCTWVYSPFTKNKPKKIVFHIWVPKQNFIPNNNWELVLRTVLKILFLGIQNCFKWKHTSISKNKLQLSFNISQPTLKNWRNTLSFQTSKKNFRQKNWKSSKKNVKTIQFQENTLLWVYLVFFQQHNQLRDKTKCENRHMIQQSNSHEER